MFVELVFLFLAGVLTIQIIRGFRKAYQARQPKAVESLVRCLFCGQESTFPDFVNAILDDYRMESIPKWTEIPCPVCNGTKGFKFFIAVNTGDEPCR